MNHHSAVRRFSSLRYCLSGLVLTGFLFTSAQSSAPPILTGKLQDSLLDEISGIAVSATHQGVLYVHNDSGDTSRFFAVNPQGALLATWYFKGLESSHGVKDCEDIALGAGEKTGRSYLYIGDIGDNRAVREYITIYRLEEPNVIKSSFAKTSALRAVYPDGPRDAETLMIDPRDRLLYILSKWEDSIGIYTLPWRFPGKGGFARKPLRLQKRGTLYFPGVKPFKYITAGDISRDGQQVLIKSYSQVFYWRRQAHEPLWKTLRRKPRQLPYTPEKQGEAIGFTPDGKACYTTSEGVHAPIFFYKIDP
ncbi:MAG: hypothetical protein P4L51_29755 [Puia sp.]|nr:hypothetical protein [Puia sp.]